MNKRHCSAVLILVAALFLGNDSSVCSQNVQAQKELKAADAKLVVYAKKMKVSGAFTMTGKDTWVEDTQDGRHSFTEVGRDEWSIYLKHKDYDIIIDLYQKKIFITEKEKERRELYNVLKAF
jgi:hypothetical protein